MQLHREKSPQELLRALQSFYIPKASFAPAPQKSFVHICVAGALVSFIVFLHTKSSSELTFFFWTSCSCAARKARRSCCELYILWHLVHTTSSSELTFTLSKPAGALASFIDFVSLSLSLSLSPALSLTLSLPPLKDSLESSYDYVHICVCTYMCVYIYVCVHICVCTYMCVYIYVCVHIYVCT